MKARSEEGSLRGLEPASASGGGRQAERRESQGAPLARLCEFPGLKSLKQVWSRSLWRKQAGEGWKPQGAPLA